MSRSIARAAVLLLALTWWACVPEHAVEGRAYDVLTPKDVDRGTPLPVVILAHGYGVSGQLQDQFFPLSRALERRRFLYVLPNGTADRWGKRFWNASDACCDFDGRRIDDVAFFRKLVADVRQRYAIRDDRVFLVGHSNGAFMGLRLACDAGDVFSGVVAVAGSTSLDPMACGNGPPVPILLNHGDRDLSVPIDGAENFPSARETGARFARRNGCGTTSWREGERLDLLSDAEAETLPLAIEGCPRRGEVELWVHEGTGHLPFYDDRWTNRVLDWLEAHAP